MAQYKLLVMGSGQLGKSALILQLIDDCPVSDHNPTLGDIYRTHPVVDGELCQLDILDTVSREDQPSEWWPFMRCGEDFLCVYAVDDIKSCVEVDILWEEVWRVRGSNDIPFVLVANKTDMTEPWMTWGLGKRAVKDFRVPYVETLAQDWHSMEWAFQGFFFFGRDWSSYGSSGVWLYRSLWPGHLILSGSPGDQGKWGNLLIQAKIGVGGDRIHAAYRTFPGLCF